MTEEEEDAKMRALFGDMTRPPLGDEAFVRAVMEKVEKAKAIALGRRQAFSLGAVALVGAILFPVRDAIGVALEASLTRYVAAAPSVSAGAVALVCAAVAGVAAWAYAERG